MRVALNEEPPPSPPQAKAALLRIPFVRRCTLAFDDGVSASAFLVNINLRGVYIASDDLPRLGQAVGLRFGLPDSDRELSLEGAVAWLNPRQQHPVHSLPPGFGVQFRNVSAEDTETLERVIMEHKERGPKPGI
jgi:Tfp pilus assembly protein PilZ